jgi:hypothetical protein
LVVNLIDSSCITTGGGAVASSVFVQAQKNKITKLNSTFFIIKVLSSFWGKSNLKIFYI